MTAAPPPGEDPDGTLVRILTCDLGAIARVRAVPSSQRSRWASHGRGWVPASLGISPLGYIVDGEPFGALGELRLVPDQATETPIGAMRDQPPTAMVMGSLIGMDGTAWECCPRNVLASAMRDLRDVTGLSVRAAIEQEFTIVEDTPSSPLSHRSMMLNEPFGSTVMKALGDAGLEPETWLPEYGRHQWEITVAPTDAQTAADRAILVREVIRHVAHAFDRRITFTPMPSLDDVGNGVHVHLSLVDENSESVMLEEGAEAGLSSIGRSFAAGILEHAQALVALTAPSPTSYERLRPGMWSASHAYLGVADRGALLRLCPPFRGGGPASRDQINLEYRAADATANPSLVMAALIRAGLDGVVRGLTVTAGESGPRLPESLSEALEALADDPVATSWLPADLLTTYLAIKQDEITQADGMTREDVAARYAAIY